MSSRYRRICMSHNPPLVLDWDVDTLTRRTPPEQPEDHPDCVIALGAYSYPLVEIWLPYPGTGAWYSIAWLEKFPALLPMFGLQKAAE